MGEGVFNSCPGDLPAFWGIEPSEFLPERVTDIESRCRKAKKHAHPDKYPDATPDQKIFLNGFCSTLDRAAERAKQNLYLMGKGYVWKPPPGGSSGTAEIPLAVCYEDATWS